MEQKQNNNIEYCYIFDYGTGEIYQCTIPNNIVNVLDYIVQIYGINDNHISYMITQTKQEIQTIEPIK